MSLRLSISDATTPEAQLARVVARIANDAGVELELSKVAGGEARAVAAVHEGIAEVGLNPVETVRWAYRAEAAYDGWRHTSLRAIGSIAKPQWLGMALSWGVNARSLEEVAERQLPLRVLAHVRSGLSVTWSFLVADVLRRHGFTLDDVVTWGGRVTDALKDGHAARSGEFDLIIAPFGAHAGPWGRVWHDAATSTDLRFLGLDDTIAERIERDHGVGSAVMPVGALRGLDQELRTLQLGRYLLYASERIEAENARTLFQALSERRVEFAALNAWFDPELALVDAGIPVQQDVRKLMASAPASEPTPS